MSSKTAAVASPKSKSLTGLPSARRDSSVFDAAPQSGGIVTITSRRGKRWSWQSGAYPSGSIEDTTVSQGFPAAGVYPAGDGGEVQGNFRSQASPQLARQLYRSATTRKVSCGSASARRRHGTERPPGGIRRSVDRQANEQQHQIKARRLPDQQDWPRRQAARQSAATRAPWLLPLRIGPGGAFCLNLRHRPADRWSTRPLAEREHPDAAVW